MGFLLPLGCLQCLQPHSLQAHGLWDGMLWRPGTKPCPDAPGTATGLAGAKQGWINPAASSPDCNLLLPSFTPARSGTPQRPLAEERLEEQGWNLRGFPQLAGEKSQAKQSSEHRQPFGTAKGCVAQDRGTRLVTGSRLSQAQPWHSHLHLAPAPLGTAAL